MATEIVMPTLGLTMTSGTVNDLYVKEGDTVSKGDVVASISSEKLTSDVESPVDGVVLKVIAHEGDDIPIKQPLMIVGAPGDAIETSQQPEEAQVKADKQVEETKPTPVAEVKPVHNANERIFITPLARKMAQKLNYDITKISGSGGNGRITRRDVERYQPQVDVAQPVQAVSQAGAGLKGMRKTIAQRMHGSLQSTAQLTLQRKADVTDLMAFRSTVAENLKQPLDKRALSVNTLVTRAVILALQDTPEMNAWYQNGTYTQIPEVHIGMAVAVDDGLIVPVIRDADQMTLTRLGAAIADVADQARRATLPSNLYSGSTFTITNLGGSGIEFFTPILNTPEIGILGVGTITKELSLDADGQIIQRQKIGLSLTFDHQIIDGTPGAEFLAKIVAYLEDPYRLVL